MSLNPNLQFTFQNDFVNSKRLIFTAGIHLSHPAAPQPFPLADPRAAGFWVWGAVFSCVGCVNLSRLFVVFAHARFNSSIIGVSPNDEI